jgi:hypothetical protein
VKVQKYEPFHWWKAVKGRATAVQKIFKPIFLLKKTNKNNILIFFEKDFGALGTSLAV